MRTSIEAAVKAERERCAGIARAMAEEERDMVGRCARSGCHRVAIIPLTREQVALELEARILAAPAQEARDE